MNQDQIDVISGLLAVIESLEFSDVSNGYACFYAPESIVDDMDLICAQARKLLRNANK